MTIRIVGPVMGPGNGNGGIVPPWLRDPIRIVLPVEPPSDDDVRLPVEPSSVEVAL